MLKNMCTEAEILGNFMNYSLSAYGVTTLYHANIPEKLIQEKAGHQCLKH